MIVIYTYHILIMQRNVGMIGLILNSMDLKNQSQKNNDDYRSIRLWDSLKDMDQVPYIVPDDAHLRIIPRLTQQKWVVFLASESS